MSTISPDFYSDIDNAINNMDFYRLYKAMCRYYHVDLLALFDLNSWPKDENIRAHCVAVDSAENILTKFKILVVNDENMIFSDIKSSIIPRIWTQAETAQCFDLNNYADEACAITFPLHTAAAMHFGLVGLMQPENVKKLSLAEVSYHSAMVFQKYYETILVPNNLPTVTLRELEVLKWSAEGKSSQEIALILSLSEQAVNSCTLRIQQKLQVNNRAQMVAAAIRTGLIQ